MISSAMWAPLLCHCSTAGVRFPRKACLKSPPCVIHHNILQATALIRTSFTIGVFWRFATASIRGITHCLIHAISSHRSTEGCSKKVHSKKGRGRGGLRILGGQDSVWAEGEREGGWAGGRGTEAGGG